jgi:rubrerythrin
VLGVKDFIVSGTTRPIDVVARINALFLTSGETYKLEFNPNAADAQKLAKDLNLQASFHCLNCNEKMILSMTLTNPKEHVFETKIVCPKCGADAK